MFCAAIWTEEVGDSCFGFDGGPFDGDVGVEWLRIGLGVEEATV